MSENADNLWSVAERLDESAGPVAVLFFILLVCVYYFGALALAAWFLSIAAGTKFGLTYLSLIFIRLAFSGL